MYNITEKKEKKIIYKTGKLTERQTTEFNKLIKENEDISVKDKYKLGKTDTIKHTIETGEAKPIKQRARKLSFKEREIEKEHIEEMLKKRSNQKIEKSMVITSSVCTKEKWRNKILY